MKRLAAFFPIVLALGALILVPFAGARADGREEGPIEIEKCQTIDQPGSYKLVKNLTAPSDTDCLVIMASLVTIDLGGFSINSKGGTTGQGIRGGGSPHQFHGIAVRNGSIVNFPDAGVFLEEPDSSTVEGLRVFGDLQGTGPPTHGKADGIIARGIIRGNIVFFTVTGFDVSGIVTGNTADGNDVGFQISVDGSSVIGNVADSNMTGITVTCPSNVIDNTAIGNSIANLVLNGTGCNNTNNVAP